MCGIVGYIGPGNATDILLEGLRRLEYRGYDSAGIAVIFDGELEIRRSVGKIINLVLHLKIRIIFLKILLTKRDPLQQMLERN